MSALRWGLVIALTLCMANAADAQLKFRKRGSADSERTTPRVASRADESAANERDVAPSRLLRANATKSASLRGIQQLPREHDQMWVEYPIDAYTSRVTTTERPERAIVDWILRETGTDVWFSEPLGVLSANKDTLRVYHTEEMHELVEKIVDRFVSSEAQQHAFRLRLVTVGNPNWRSKALPLLKSVSVQSPGVEAWMVSKENAVVLLDQLRKRTDFQEQSAPALQIHNGQSQSIASLRVRNYMRGLKLRQSPSPTYELEPGQIQEGYTLEVSPLLTADGRSVEAVIKCEIDQIERLIPVALELPGVAARNAGQIQVPQLSSWRLHERFRWPTDEVLLLSCGVIANPTERRSGPLGLGRVLSAGSPNRADALLMIQYMGEASQVFETDATTAGIQVGGRY